MKKLAIVVQGSSEYVNNFKDIFKKQKLIFSTWEGEESSYLSEDEVIFNKKPIESGPSNIALQQLTSYKGILHAKKLGFTHVLKIRSDLIPTNGEEFVRLIDNDQLNFLCWHCHEVYNNCPGYLIDFLMSGPVDIMLTLWNINDFTWCVVPEIFLTWQYILYLQKIIDINFFLNDLNKQNDLYWIKRNVLLSTYKQLVPDLYNKYTFNNNKEFLSKNYRNFLNITK